MNDWGKKKERCNTKAKYCIYIMRGIVQDQYKIDKTSFTKKWNPTALQLVFYTNISTWGGANIYR